MMRRWLLVCLVVLSACAPDFRPAGPAIQAPVLTLSEAQDQSDPAFITAADGTQLPLKKWPATGETRAVVLALHGFTDYRQAFALPAAAWSTVGVTTYAYDQRGFGAAGERLRWAGTETYVNDARQALALVRRQHPGVPLYLLGESMGGAVAILAVTETKTAGDVADGLILIAPAVMNRPALGEFERTVLDVTANLLPWAMSGRRGVGSLPTDNIPLLRVMSRDPLMQREVRFDQIYGLLLMLETATQRIDQIDMPSLVLFGGKDEILPAGVADYFRDTVPETLDDELIRIETIPDAYHMLLRDIEASDRHERVAAWMLDEDRLAQHAELKAD
ncbi:MAG: alpha/beta fold hydrolase [Alphaproteobacteria bacterium]|nr:alpha/beta fold hydrolase [Alphaproteobacteria bacterium SS10]